MVLLPSKTGKNDKIDRIARFKFPGSGLDGIKQIKILVQENILKVSKNCKSLFYISQDPCHPSSSELSEAKTLL